MYIWMIGYINCRDVLFYFIDIQMLYLNCYSINWVIIIYFFRYNYLVVLCDCICYIVNEWFYYESNIFYLILFQNIFGWIDF